MRPLAILLFLVALAPQPCAAQISSALVLTRTASGIACVGTRFPTPCDGGCAAGSFCLETGVGAACVPDGTILCCSGDPSCGVGDSCRFVTGPAGTTAGVCAPPGADYCNPGLEGIIACHTLPDGGLTSEWELGDCDGDGLANGYDRDFDICAAPWVPPLAVDLATCVDLPLGCHPAGTSCLLEDGRPGECVGLDTGTVCTPADGAVHCCFEDADCDGGDGCVPVAADGLPGRCMDTRCVGELDDLSGCLLDPVTGALVPFPSGDCDHDGTINEIDENPCVFDTPPADAGVVPARDAGTNTTSDAGGSMSHDDGGTDVTPRFGGGGGCACRANAGASRTAAWAWLFLALPLLRRRRRG